MLEIFLFLFPTCISMLIYNYFHKNEENIKKLILVYCSYCTFINLLVLGVINSYADASFYLSDNIYRLGFIFKYLVCAVIFSIILPIVVEFINKNISFDIKFRKINNEKKNPKK